MGGAAGAPQAAAADLRPRLLPHLLLYTTISLFSLPSIPTFSYIGDLPTHVYTAHGPATEDITSADARKRMSLPVIASIPTDAISYENKQ